MLGSDHLQTSGISESIMDERLELEVTIILAHCSSNPGLQTVEPSSCPYIQGGGLLAFARRPKRAEAQRRWKLGAVLFMANTIVRYSSLCHEHEYILFVTQIYTII